MRVVVSGATGTLGGAVAAALIDRGDAVAGLSRDATRAARTQPRVEWTAWPSPEAAEPPARALAGADAVVHLLGEPVSQRWTAAAKRRIRESRVDATRRLVDAIRGLPAGDRPRVLVSQSATGYYGAHGDEWVDESSPAGDDFLARLVVDWEAEARRAEELGVRVVRTRTGVVLSPRGGALGAMLPPFRLGVGGPVAGGRQYVPWVHLEDVAGAVLHVLDDDRATGAVNVVAPEPVTNAELSHALGGELHRPSFMPVPGLGMRALYGEMAMIVTTGQRVRPAELERLGYRFRYPALGAALHDVLAAAS